MSPSTIQDPGGVNYTVGAISNQTGDLKNLDMYINGNKALVVEGAVEVDQKGTFDLELTDKNGKTFTVTFEVVITA